jgi:hypothetical protein
MSDEFDNLLNQLDDEDGGFSFVEPKSVESTKISDDLDSLEDSISSASVIRPISTTTEFSISQVQAPITTTDLLDKYGEQLETVTRQILDACRTDRQEAQEVISDLRDRLSNIDGAPPRSLVDGLVKAIEVKSSINQNAIKIMDTNAKFIAASKPKIGTQNNLNISDSTEELKKILGPAVD